MLEQKGITAPTAYKTGTTIVGLIYKVKIYERKKTTKWVKTVLTLCIFQRDVKMFFQVLLLLGYYYG